MKVFFVYLDWTLENIPRPFYVGKGNTVRLRSRRRNAYWKNIVAKYGWRREVVLVTKDEQFAFEEEKRLIAELGTFENGTPGRWGANLTEGGEGPSGRRHTSEVLILIRQSVTGSKHPMYGKRHTVFSKEKNRVAHLGKTHSEATKKRMSQSHPSEICNLAILDWRKVERIRTRYRESKISYKRLASEFGVCRSTVGAIIRNETWKTKENEDGC